MTEGESYMKKGTKELLELGKRIKKARLEARLTQYELHMRTGISITQISAYENGNRSIGLHSLFKISEATGKTMDEIYGGPAETRPTSQAENKGALIVNCIVALYEEKVIDIDANPNGDGEYETVLCFPLYEDEIEDLIIQLNNFDNRKNDYPDPDNFKKQILTAAAKRINASLK